MIAFWIGLPVELRLMIVAIAGLIGGALANHVIYTFAYFNPRPISPWGVKAEGVGGRKLSDRIPVVGWFGLRREASVHGSGFWVRPLLIELAMAIAMPSLYWFETQAGGLLPAEAKNPVFLPIFEPTGTCIFFAHAILLILMVAATFIDFDEKTIPDIITITGTWIGLALGAWTVLVFMPTSLPVGGMATSVAPTPFDSPWFHVPNRWMTTRGLWTGLGIWSVWCFALADRRWSGVLVRRRGLSRAINHFCAGLVHYGFWKLLVLMWIAGTIGISILWKLGGDHWIGLFSSLVGLAVGGGVVWAIRIVASWAMNVEAMGFGDVTLMAMIGAFIGWQGALSAFFLAPFAAIVIVIVQYAITRDPHVPFGPYLCAGGMLTIVNWDRVYNGWLAPNLLTIGPMLLWICITMLGLMAVMLFVWRHIKMRLYRD